MKRLPEALEEGVHDLVVVGGGILGACIAWDASLRGLSVVLIEEGDFGQEASANNLKILHGGLRYLQSAHLRRCRESVRERRFWLRVAPHLTAPLPVIFPARREVLRHRSVLRAGAALNDLLSADRNQGVEEARHLPATQGLTRHEVLRRIPELESPELTGGIRFFDALMHAPERLVLEVVLAAAAAGTIPVNYVSFRRGLWEDGRPTGVLARDVLGGGEIRVRARAVVNAAGGATDRVAAGLLAARSGRHPSERRTPGKAAPGWSSAVNLVTDPLGPKEAFALPVREAGVQQNLFVVPWRGRSLIGTGHVPLGRPLPDGLDPEAGRPDLVHEWKEQVRRDASERFLETVQRALPQVQRDRVHLVHWGLLPTRGPGETWPVDLLPRHRIVDHGRDGVPGAFSVVAVKFTTARAAARAAVDRVCRWLGQKTPSRLTSSAALPGTPAGGFEALGKSALHRHGCRVPREVLDELLRTHGARYESVLSLHREEGGDLEPIRPDSPVTPLQLRHAARHELVARPEDLVWRRTALGPRGDGDARALMAAREAMGLDPRGPPPPRAPEVPIPSEQVTGTRQPTRDAP